MKRQFSIFDGLFLLGLYFKLSGTGLILCWPAVFLPYMVEGFLATIGAFATLFSWRERLKFWFWKMAMSIRVRRAGADARAYMKGVEKAHQDALKAKHNPPRPAGSNPGQFIDPADLGKK